MIVNYFILMFRNNHTSIVSWEPVHLKWDSKETKACPQLLVNLNVRHVVKSLRPRKGSLFQDYVSQDYK